MKTNNWMLMAFLLLPGVVHSAQDTADKISESGPVIEGFGPVMPVEQTTPLSGKEHFRVVFDVAEQGEPDKANRRFESLARFLNMQARAGVPAKQVELALVVHGKAGFDLLNNTHFEEKYGQQNPNAPLLAQLQKHNVRVILCGQSAGFSGIEPVQLLPGVEMALSAMTAHALLQQQGYTLNPF
ncbi:DsrE family protein [Microbulbifer aggregans]|uniref:DsrE family protein n=1 Tax=Microbulbifer aggregans TaxID=1769779 RepID=UPI001CFE33AD|nr:DsrE family protein [Microbulbifer aggregans]